MTARWRRGGRQAAGPRHRRADRARPGGRPRPGRAARARRSTTSPGSTPPRPASSSRPTLHTRLGTALPPDVDAGRAGIRSGDVLVAPAAPYAGTPDDHVARGAATPRRPGAFSVTWFASRSRSRRWPAGSARGPAGWTATSGRLTVGLLGFSRLPRRAAGRAAQRAPRGGRAGLRGRRGVRRRLGTRAGAAADGRRRHRPGRGRRGRGRPRARRPGPTRRCASGSSPASALFLVTGAGALLARRPAGGLGAAAGAGDAGRAVRARPRRRRARPVPHRPRAAGRHRLVGARAAARAARPDRRAADRGRRSSRPAAPGSSPPPRGGLAVVAVLARRCCWPPPTCPSTGSARAVLVGFAGAALLLAARSYRHPAARALLRGAGLTCWAALVVVLLGRASTPRRASSLGIAGIVLAVLLVVVAVATGRGWRSAWWSRRAEVAEGLAGAGAIAGPGRGVRAVPCACGNSSSGFSRLRPRVDRRLSGSHTEPSPERPHRTHDSGGCDMPPQEREEATWRSAQR